MYFETKILVKFHLNTNIFISGLNEVKKIVEINGNTQIILWFAYRIKVAANWKEIYGKQNRKGKTIQFM